MERLTQGMLHEYQHDAVNFIIENPSCALFLECGLGKTITTLTALSSLVNQYEIIKTLVVAPKRVVATVWAQEAQKWTHTDYLTFSSVIGSPAQRERALEKKADVYLINYENLVWLIEHKTIDFDFDALIFDEFSKMKAFNSKRFKAVKKVLPCVNRVIGLTGTPAPNSLLDLWSLSYILDRGKRLGKAYTGFRERYFQSDYMGYNWKPHAGSATEIHSLLEDICLTLTADEYLKLPRRIDNIIEVELPSAARHEYDELESDCLIKFEGQSLAVQNPAILTNKLLQFSNGAVYTDDEGTYKIVHDAKLEALDDIIQEAVGNPVLVAYNYKSDLSRLRERFPKAEHINDAPDTIERWNKGEIDILLAHPASAGHGLNLQDGGNTIVWFGLNWSLELYLQFNARLYRQGQTKPVFIHHIVTKDSVDQSVIESLQNKDQTQQALLDALKWGMSQRMKRKKVVT
ncbi:DNA phosphorothioation system restriction enzyme (plasmid) [Piscirickettsia salmonis]|nr:DNA phosphorothioation system restriction enzyme [Piscirickettsia salmonis]